MQIQLIKGINYNPKTNDTRNTATPNDFSTKNHLLSDAVSFGSIKSEANQKSLEIVSAVFTELIPLEPIPHIKFSRSFSQFKITSNKAIEKIKQNMSIFKLSDFPDRPKTHCEYGNEGRILAGKEGGKTVFKQINKYGVCEQYIEMEPISGTVKIYSKSGNKRPLVKIAIGNIYNEKNLDLIKLAKYPTKEAEVPEKTKFKDFRVLEVLP